MILDKIDELLKEVQNLSAKNAEEVEQLRLKYLSKKGEITALMNDFRREECDTQESGDEAIDLTRTPYPVELGTRHPLSIVTNEIIDIFSRMGFVLADGPEVEDDNHIFRHAGHLLRQPASQRCHEEHPAPLSHLQRTGPYHGADAHRGRQTHQSDPRHLSGSCVS